jgi:Zn-dependent M28 family amino/carboxypeptidase
VRKTIAALFLIGCVSPAPTRSPATAISGVDVDQIVRDARVLADDSLRGRGPWTPENERAARLIAARLTAIGAKPLIGNSLLVPFVSEKRPNDTVYNVVGIIGNPASRLIGITAHLDHLGVGRADSTGDSVYNGFLDDAIGVGMSLEVARRYAQAPGNRGLIVMFFNLEEQGLLGSKAFVERPDVAPIMERMDLLIGVDAGSPAGEALDWQLMGGLPEHTGTRLADSIAQARGWATVSTPPRAISDVFPFSQKGVPILFPIPGQRWRTYTANERNQLMRRFDHYHQPGDEYDPAFPLVGTRHFADWLYAIVSQASRWP